MECWLFIFYAICPNNCLHVQCFHSSHNKYTGIPITELKRVRKALHYLRFPFLTRYYHPSALLLRLRNIYYLTATPHGSLYCLPCLPSHVHECAQMKLCFSEYFVETIFQRAHFSNHLYQIPFRMWIVNDMWKIPRCAIYYRLIFSPRFQMCESDSIVYFIRWNEAIS